MQFILEGRAQISSLLCGPQIGFYLARKSYWNVNNGPVGSKNSFNEEIRNKEGRQVIWQRTPITIIYPICFPLNRMEKGKNAHQRLMFEVQRPLEVII